MDILNPVGPRHPNQIGGEGSKVSEEQQPEVYIEGAEYIPLPSKGVFYTFDPRYKGMEKLMVRQLNYTDEDILTTKSYLEDGSVFNELLKNVIVDPNGFPSGGLSPIDRDTILLWLRSTSFGNDFEAETSCPKCGHKHSVKWDISKLSIPEYDPEILAELQEFGEITIETPLKNLRVKIAQPSIGKSKEFEKQLAAKKNAQKTKTDLFGTGSIMLIVNGVEVEDKIIRKKNEIENYFNKIKLPLADARYIRKSFEKISLRYDTAQDITCANCEYVQEGVEMPMLHPNFFWPDTRL
jgi:hypothetical protein